MDSKLVFELFKDFLSEGLDVLRVQENNRLVCKQGVMFICDKAEPIFLDEKKGILYIFPMFFELMSHGKEIPTPIRLLAYSYANKWKRFIEKGALIEDNEDDLITSYAISILKGLQLFDQNNLSNLFQKIRNKVRELFGMEIELRKATNGKIIRTISVISNDSALKSYMNEVINLMDKEKTIIKPLRDFKGTELGTQNNPFENVDEAAAFILQYEQERLSHDNFRQFITNLPYFIDTGSRCFRIPWAGAYCAYQKCPNIIENGFVVNQLLSRRFNFKPCLYNHKFLFRGQAEYYTPCVPNIFRNKDDNYFLKYTIFTCEMQVLLRSHPLVNLFNQGFELFNDFFRFEVNYGGLSQHYYNRTQFLDLTSDINAAKFFAVTTFDFANNKYIPYTGERLGVLYFYDIEPNAFVLNNHAGYQLSAIGKQPFMRSGAQHGYLLAMETGLDFNKLPQVRCVFFKHNHNITKRIYETANNGELYQVEDILQDYWYDKMSNDKLKNRVSIEAVELNRKFNPKTSKTKILKYLRQEGITVYRDSLPKFSDVSLKKYYYDLMPNYWNDFCKDIYFFSPEGRVLHKHLLDLPKDLRYRSYFKN